MCAHAVRLTLISFSSPMKRGRISLTAASPATQVVELVPVSSTRSAQLVLQPMPRLPAPLVPPEPLKVWVWCQFGRATLPVAYGLATEMFGSLVEPDTLTEWLWPPV